MWSSMREPPVAGLGNVHELLDAVSAAESVGDVGGLEGDAVRLTGYERRGLFKGSPRISCW